MKLPHLALLAVSLAAAIVAWLMAQNASGAIVLPAVVLAVLPLVNAVLGMLSPSVVASTNAKAALAAGDVAPVSAMAKDQAQDIVTKAAAKIAPLAMLCLAFLVSGCISSAPVVPVTPQNAAQISSCQGTASLHNGVVIGGFVLGGASAGLASASASLSDTSARTDTAIAGAIIGGMAIVDTAIAELTASNFSNSQCSAVVGPLPTAPKPAPVTP